jgi:hypothetical protein
MTDDLKQEIYRHLEGLRVHTRGIEAALKKIEEDRPSGDPREIVPTLEREAESDRR